MERIHNPEMEQVILNHLANLYNIKEKREGIHLSDVVLCLTKSYFNQVEFIEPTEEEVMLFVIGLGLQDILTPQEAETPVYKKDGIMFSPDFVLKIGESEFHELKTSRVSMKNLLLRLPETWVDYIMGGCYIRRVTTYELTNFLLMGTYAPPFPKLRSETLIFTKKELIENWNMLISRRDILLSSLEAKYPPTPKNWCKYDSKTGFWECKYCRYKIVCDSIKMLEGHDDTVFDYHEEKLLAEHDTKEEWKNNG